MLGQRSIFYVDRRWGEQGIHIIRLGVVGGSEGG